MTVDSQIGAALHGNGLRRGTVVTIDGAGSAAATLELLSATTRIGEWGAVVELSSRPREMAGLAAAEVGVSLERCAIVRDVSSERWPAVISALLEAMSMVATAVPSNVRMADARRLITRARERQAVLVVVGAGWPAEASLRINAGPSRWHGLEFGDGLLAYRDLSIAIADKGAVRHAHLGQRALAG